MDQWFIGTDYTSWALVYSCVITDPVSGECTEVAAWVWSRAQTLSDDDRDAVDALLPTVCLSFADLHEMPVGEGNFILSKYQLQFVQEVSTFELVYGGWGCLSWGYYRVVRWMDDRCFKINTIYTGYTHRTRHDTTRYDTTRQK
jgi:hypothetical protein